MALDYDSFFTISKIYCSAYKKTIFQNEDVKASILHSMETMRGDAERSNELQLILKIYDKWQSYLTSSIAGQIEGAHDSWLVDDGYKVIGSGKSSGATIAGDLASFMTRDSQSVLLNVINKSIAYNRSGDGTALLVQNQLTKNDIISLTCITAQTADIDAEFNISTSLNGALSYVFTADGVTDYTDSDIGRYLGFESFIINGGSAGNYWSLGDQIIITTTSDDRSFLLSAYRDWYNIELPSSATPTISNTLVDAGTSFPTTPSDGEEFVIDGIKYYYSETLTEWIEACS